MADLHLDYIDYKKLFKNRETRLKIINKLGFIPTVPYLKIVYKIKTGKKLDLKNPKTFTEKINWLKINDVHPEYSKYVDKYYMKKFIAEKYGEDKVFKLLGAWDNFDDIDFDTLPDKFVLKCSHDSASVHIIEDKSKINKQELRKFYNGRLKINAYNMGREYPYKTVKPRIIAEELHETDDGNVISDYRIFCFNGKVKFFYVFSGRNKDERETWFYADKTPMEGIIDPTGMVQHDNLVLPPCLDDMFKMAEELAKGIKLVRVDLYEDKGKFYFGEMTFFPYGGYTVLQPEGWDRKIGDMLEL
ncbi:MAG: glycosyl transferase [Clostridia bacterium]|nr:glycosyl transferase [Clostridia bacterium]